jgi:hypothetical protein
MGIPYLDADLSQSKMEQGVGLRPLQFPNKKTEQGRAINGRRLGDACPDSTPPWNAVTGVLKLQVAPGGNSRLKKK